MNKNRIITELVGPPCCNIYGIIKQELFLPGKLSSCLFFILFLRQGVNWKYKCNVSGFWHSFFFLLTGLRSGHSLMIHTGDLRRIKRWKKAPSMHFHTPAPTITQRTVDNNLGKLRQKDKQTEKTAGRH